jgi:hypothetical protein
MHVQTIIRALTRVCTMKGHRSSSNPCNFNVANACNANSPTYGTKGGFTEACLQEGSADIFAKPFKGLEFRRYSRIG